MNKCHLASIDMLEDLFGDISGKDDERVLEVACGDGRLSKDFLHKHFKCIDMFDKDFKACQIAKGLKSTVK